MFTIGSVVAALAFISFAVWGEYTRKAHVSGYLVPSRGFVKVYAHDVGTITERRVEEGQAVKKGDILYVLSLDRGSNAGLQAGQVALDETRRRREALLKEKLKLAQIGRVQGERSEEHMSELQSRRDLVCRLLL